MFKDLSLKDRLLFELYSSHENIFNICNTPVSFKRLLNGTACRKSKTSSIKDNLLAIRGLLDDLITDGLIEREAKKRCSFYRITKEGIKYVEEAME